MRYTFSVLDESSIPRIDAKEMALKGSVCLPYVLVDVTDDTNREALRDHARGGDVRPVSRISRCPHWGPRLGVGV